MPLTTRLAVASDYATFATLFPELAVPDPLPTRETFEARMLPRVVLAFEGDVPVGYAFFLTYGPTGHILHVVVAPAHRGKRIGERLLEDVRGRAKAEGCERVYLNVKKENDAALRLYRRAGLEVESSAWAMRFDWSHLAGLPRVAGVRALVPMEAEDPLLAERFGLDVERIRLLRRRPKEELVTLREDHELVAFAGFAPDYPGAYPFRTTRPGLAGELLRAIEPVSDPAYAFLHISVEGDEPLARYLLDRGAELTFELFRMGAPLP